MSWAKCHEQWSMCVNVLGMAVTLPPPSGSDVPIAVKQVHVKGIAEHAEKMKKTVNF